MTKKDLLLACAFSTLALGISSPASAQVGEPGAPPSTLPDPQEPADGITQGDIVVTGTLIRGSAENTALPIDVISGEELANQGNPSALDLLKNLPTSNGVIGDANQFDARAQGSEGVASVNLRGLGPQRTLVLLNGKRIVSAGTGIPVVDVNLIPGGAIGRVEVLKDGAAATYGSDAVAGVVNFITRSEQQGFLASGDYRYIDGSDGDYGGAISFGHHGDGLQFLASFGYQHRSELRTTDRDFTVQPFPNNPSGGYTGGGNPGNFDFNGLAGTPSVVFTADQGCTALGSFRSLPGSNTDRCFTNFGRFDNLVEPEDRYQAYIETAVDFSDRLTGRVSALYGSSSTRITTSPSYLPTLPPSGNAAGLPTLPTGQTLPGFFQIPNYAPALRDYCQTFGASAGCLVGPTGAPVLGALAFPVLFRPLLAGGNPVFRSSDNDRGSAFSQRQSESIRFTADLAYEVTDNINLDAGFTYSRYDRGIEGTDTFGDLLQNALAGFGGANCAFATPQSRAGLTAAQIAAAAGTNGCTFFNPFSTAVSANGVTGQVNPNFAGARNPAGFNLAPGAGLLNDNATIDNFFRTVRSDTKTQLFVGDLVLSGQTGINLPGGQIGFAIGGQYRKNYYAIRYNQDSNLAVNPCPGSPLNPAATCSPQTGALGFLGTNRDRRTDNDIYAAFAELQLPIIDAVNVQLSARYEDYGGNVGSTFDPQGRVKFQVTDWLALRGGAGTTFRGPPPQALFGQVTSLQVIGSSFRAVDIQGNADLAPESATTYNAGVLIDRGIFTGSVDYFRYEFQGPQEAEPVAGIVNALFGASGTANCGAAAFALLQQRFDFTPAGCGIGNVQRLRTNLVNSANIKNSGIDAQAQLKLPFGGDGQVTLGAQGTYIIDYQIDDVTVEGIVVQPAFDAVGLLNFQTSAYPLPEIKGQVYLQGEYGIHNARLQFNYIDGYTDQRGAAIFGPNAGALAGASVLAGRNIGSFKTVDFTYRIALPTGTTIALTANNIFDEDPPFARLDFNYDPFTATPLGFNAKIGVSQKF